VTYLNTATAPPAARSVLAAVRRAEAEWEAGLFDWQSWEAEAHATRALFGQLIGADASSIALLGSVAEGAATVARSLEPPGRVVVGAGEFRSNLLPWLALRDKGFDVVEVPAVNGVVTTDAFVDAIDRRTILVALTEVQSANGFRVRIPEIASRAHDVGARLFLSAMQSLGVLRLDVRESDPDFVVAHGYKWLLAPRGAAWLYVRTDRIAELEPLAANWKNVPDPYATYYGAAPLAADARKLDASLAWFSWIGAKAALDLVCSLPGVEVEKRALSLAREFSEAAERAGFALAPREMPSQIVAVTVADAEALWTRLADRRVLAAVRGGYLRVGFHAFNDRTDVQAALEALIASRR
jgi:selenocysteine lyase/cysteine desulfurase